MHSITRDSHFPPFAIFMTSQFEDPDILSCGELQCTVCRTGGAISAGLSLTMSTLMLLNIRQLLKRKMADVDKSTDTKSEHTDYNDIGVSNSPSFLYTFSAEEIANENDSLLANDHLRDSCTSASGQDVWYPWALVANLAVSDAFFSLVLFICHCLGSTTILDDPHYCTIAGFITVLCGTSTFGATLGLCSVLLAKCKFRLSEETYNRYRFKVVAVQYVVAFGLAAIPFIGDAYGQSVTYGTTWCWIQHEAVAYRFAAFYGYLGLVYIFEIVSGIIITLEKRKRVVRYEGLHARVATDINEPDSSTEAPMLRLFAVAFVLVWSGPIVNGIYEAVACPSYKLYLLQAVAMPLQGLVNFLFWTKGSFVRTVLRLFNNKCNT